MTYSESVLHYKVSQCLKCGAQTDITDEKEFFCSQCGAPVLNKCSNYDCNEFLDSHAKYCKYCGAKSIFYNYGLLDNSFTLINDTEDLPF